MSESKRIYLCDKITMEIVEIYLSAYDARMVYGHSSIHNSCVNRAVNGDRYVWRYEDDYDPNESFEGKYNRPIMCGDYEKGRIFFFNSMQVASQALGLHKNVIYDAIKKNVKVKNRYRFKFAR